MVLSPDGRTCITCGGGFEACVWDLSKGSLLRCLEGHSSWVVDVAVSPDACRAATASHDGRIMYGWWLNCTLEHTLVHTHLCTHIYTIHTLNTHTVCCRMWDLWSGACEHVMDNHAGRVNRVAISQDGQRLVSASDDTTYDCCACQIVCVNTPTACACMTPARASCATR